ncbi:LysE family translocator [Bordetella sp. FB-8]|uniref:LysE family translocator n=1 Tax=Bordetella sp. FB-8 TaxID=1159870 RepID=UPI000374FA78|nr:LysE family transporter [Bordetella sp. FB-8]
MSALIAVLSIAGALCLGAMSPGPSFVLVARTAVGTSRRDGMATALGMGVGGVVFSVLALAGLYTVLSMVAWLYAALKIGGGLYLLFLAVKIWRGARQPFAFDQGIPAQRSGAKPAFWVGLATQLSNPKTAIVYGSVFVSLLPQHPPAWCYAALPAIVFTIEAGWYTVVALCFSSQRPRSLYLRAKAWIDRLSAGVIAALGLRLILTAGKSGI